MNKVFMISMLILSQVAMADLMTFERGSLQLENINLSPRASINLENGQPSSQQMDLLGAGLRSKTVLVVSAKVYILQLFADNKASFVRDAQNALSSVVTGSKNTALKISMLRTVSASSLAVSFKEALQANGYAIDQELSQVLSIVEKGSDGVQGKDLFMLMQKEAGKVTLSYQDSAGKISKYVGSEQLAQKILSIWLGKPADDGLSKLKNQLLKPIY
jgi:Chalcone isomerase-like